MNPSVTAAAQTGKNHPLDNLGANPSLSQAFAASGRLFLCGDAAAGSCWASATGNCWNAARAGDGKPGAATPALGEEGGSRAPGLGKEGSVSSLFKHSASTSPEKHAQERQGYTFQGSRDGILSPSGYTTQRWSGLPLMNTWETKKKRPGEKIIPLPLNHHSTKGLFCDLWFKSVVNPWGQLLNFKRSSSRCWTGGSFTCSIQRKFNKKNQTTRKIISNKWDFLAKFIQIIFFPLLSAALVSKDNLLFPFSEKLWTDICLQYLIRNY